ncbi:MAG: hypothetical protein AAF551_06800 [Bacteroidota bacterium]
MTDNSIQVALIGDRNGKYLPHTSAESIIPKIAADLALTATVSWIPTGAVKETDLSQYQIIWSGSGPYLNPEGAIEAIRFAREHHVPFIGTCSGFKYTIIELAKNVCKSENPEAYISFNESCGTEYKELTISLHSSKTKTYYESAQVRETSHCRFEINAIHQEEVNRYFTFAGTANDGRMVIAELTEHPFFLATLFLPQLKTRSQLLSQLMLHAAKLV